MEERGRKWKGEAGNEGRGRKWKGEAGNGRMKQEIKKARNGKETKFGVSHVQGPTAYLIMSASLAPALCSLIQRHDFLVQPLVGQ